MAVKDYSVEAEALFRDFAARHSFAIEKVEEPAMTLLMRVPAQRGLSFDLNLGQQDDELNIGWGKFWSYLSPCNRVAQWVADVLDAIARGECRLATHQQFGAVYKRSLEQLVENQWRSIYSAYEGVRVPLLRTKVLYEYNDAAGT